MALEVRINCSNDPDRVIISHLGVNPLRQDHLMPGQADDKHPSIFPCCEHCIKSMGIWPYASLRTANSR